MAIVKYNGGRGALLCEACRVIVATGNDIPKHLLCNPSENEHYFCSEECRDKKNKKNKQQCKIFKIKTDEGD